MGQQTAKWPKTHSKEKLEVSWLHFNVKTTGADNSKNVTGKHQKQILFRLWFKSSKTQPGLNLTWGLIWNPTKQHWRPKGDLLWCFQVCWRASTAASQAPENGGMLCWKQLAWEFHPWHWVGHTENGWRGLETQVRAVSSSGGLFLDVDLLP